MIGFYSNDRFGINIAEVLISRKNIGEEMMLSRKTWGKGFHKRRLFTLSVKQ